MNSATLAFASTMVLVFSACSAKKSSNGMNISLNATQLSQLTSALPVGRTPCFGISIDGTNIPAKSANACSPPTGLLSGYAQASQSLQATVSMGSTINLSVFMYLIPAGRGTTCPALNAAFPMNQLGDTYLVGTAKGISINQSEVTIDITSSFDGIAQNITKQLGMSTACQAAAQPSLPALPYMIGAGDKTMSGSGLQMHAHAGRPYQPRVLSGTGIQMKVR